MARSLYALADMLLMRNTPADSAHAASHLDRAASIAMELDLLDLLAKIGSAQNRV
jgi:hypothetical protein